MVSKKSTPTTYDMHPYSELFPTLDHDARASLKASIEDGGQAVPIVLFEGKVLDGRHRYLVTQELGIEAKTTTFKGTDADALDYVVKLNAIHRHMTPGQRAWVSVGVLRALRTIKPGRGAPNIPKATFKEEGEHVAVLARRGKQGPNREAADRIGVAGVTVTRAEKIAEANPEVFAGLGKGIYSVIEAEVKAGLSRPRKFHETPEFATAIVEGKRHEDPIFESAEARRTAGVKAVVPAIVAAGRSLGGIAAGFKFDTGTDAWRANFLKTIENERARAAQAALQVQADFVALAETVSTTTTIKKAGKTK